MGPSDPTRGQSPSELKHQLELERAGLDFVVVRDATGGLRTHALESERVLIGRSASADIAIEWDPRVSEVHAELARLAGRWVLADEGLSRNGSFVAGERVAGRRVLADRDLITVGDTALLFRGPPAASRERTQAPAEHRAPAVTPAQHRVLVALCRPFASGEEFATPASNGAIAAELHLSVDAVKGHLRALFEAFGVAALPQNEKRMRLAERALRTATVNPRDLLANGD